MKAIYINHSGTAVVFENLVMVFDPEKAVLPEAAEGRQVLFFVSHAHQDHFNPEITKFGKTHEKVTYCLSSDILEANKECPELFEGLSVTSVQPDMQISVEAGGEAIEVTTLNSTDQGVAFLIRYNGKTIYHAGDLNCWAWPGESTEYCNKEIADYRREIDKLKDTYIDLAFVPLDPRLEENAGMAMDYFIEKVPFGHVMPIHMWGKYELIGTYKDTLPEEQREKVLETTGKMQEFSIPE